MGNLVPQVSRDLGLPEKSTFLYLPRDSKRYSVIASMLSPRSSAAAEATALDSEITLGKLDKEYKGSDSFCWLCVSTVGPHEPMPTKWPIPTGAEASSSSASCASSEAEFRHREHYDSHGNFDNATDVD